MKPKVIIKLAVDVLIEKHEKGTENRWIIGFTVLFFCLIPVK